MVVEIAERMAREAHKGQTRKYTGESYIIHPWRVSARVAVYPGATQEMVAVVQLENKWIEIT